MRPTRRNQHEIQCHYCKAQCAPGEAEIWNYKGRWYACCDTCKLTNDKQIAATEKRATRRAQAEEAKATTREARPRVSGQIVNLGGGR